MPGSRSTSPGAPPAPTYLEQMRTTIRLTGMLTEDQIPREGRDELLRVFQAWRAERATS